MFSFFKKKSSHYTLLADKWSDRHKSLQTQLWSKHADIIDWFINTSKNSLLSSVAGLVLLASPGGVLQSSTPVVVKEKQFRDIAPDVFFLNDLTHIVPQDVRPLTSSEETSISQLLSNRYHLSVSPQINGIHLNRSYGLIGQEQHLARFPGDTIDSHFDPFAGGREEANRYASIGMAPGLGAWGYFAYSKSQLTQEEVLREKYYIAVQTFLAPGYMEHVGEYNAFFKYRKMLVVNPQNGKAVVADIADAGPSPWTGKSLGGSPEVMKYLERVDGAQKGPVLYFFISDPTNSVALGPIN